MSSPYLLSTIPIEGNGIWENLKSCTWSAAEWMFTGIFWLPVLHPQMRRGTEYQSRRFSAYTENLRELRDWLFVNGCKDVCMKSSEKYWLPVQNILEDSCHVVVSHPKFVKTIKEENTDKKDAQWIVDLFKHDLVRSRFMPPKDIRQLRDLCRYWVKLSSYMTGEKTCPELLHRFQL